MHKTTIYLDDDVYERLQRFAEEHGSTQASVVREAIAKYTAHVRRKRPRSIGMGRSKIRNLSEQTGKYLQGFGEDSE